MVYDPLQVRQKPNVGPGPAQMSRNSGFVNSKTDGDNAAVLSKLWCDLKKKGLHFNGFFGRNQNLQNKKRDKVFTDIL